MNFTHKLYSQQSKIKRDSTQYHKPNCFRILYLILLLCVALPQNYAQTETKSELAFEPFIKFAPIHPPTKTIPLTIVFSFSKKFFPAKNGVIVFGVYSSKEAYDVISALRYKDMTRANTEVSEGLWDNYYRIEIPYSEKKNYTYQLNVNPQLPYAISVFYDRDDNREFTFFASPTENFGFSNYKKKITVRKPRFEEIKFSPQEYQNKPLVIEMNP